MDEAAIRHLNAINRRFYATAAAEFDASRQRAWPGWERLIPLLKPPLSVLDVGCGNGRFGVFLADRLGKERLRYTGIDSSAALLDRARPALAGIDVRLLERDLVKQPPDAALGLFDLVALFGVLHHVPGADRRLDLLRALADRVAPGGLLVWTEWRFLGDAKMRERIVAWEGGAEIEAGDYLLEWRRGTRVVRYCHAVDDAEHARLVAAAGLPPLAEYRADAANLYTLLRRPP